MPKENIGEQERMAYKVVEFQRDPDGYVEYAIEGPTDDNTEFISPRFAQSHCDLLNAAYSAGRSSLEKRVAELEAERTKLFQDIKRAGFEVIGMDGLRHDGYSKPKVDALFEALGVPNEPLF